MDADEELGQPIVSNGLPQFRSQRSWSLQISTQRRTFECIFTGSDKSGLGRDWI
jgi:hypothetical protein